MAGQHGFRLAKRAHLSSRSTIPVKLMALPTPSSFGSAAAPASKPVAVVEAFSACGPPLRAFVESSSPNVCLANIGKERQGGGAAACLLGSRIQRPRHRRSLQFVGRLCCLLLLLLLLLRRWLWWSSSLLGLCGGVVGDAAAAAVVGVTDSVSQSENATSAFESPSQPRNGQAALFVPFLLSSCATKETTPLKPHV